MNITYFAIVLIYMGFIIGLGAVTVIDIHGFLARKSLYWTQATIQTHKITKLLIWLGTTLKFIGLLLVYFLQQVHPYWLVTLSILMILIINGMYLSLCISPELLKHENEGVKTLLPAALQTKVLISFLISFTGWWLNFFLITYLLFIL
ncbi:MAG: hypothetical protein RLY61_848 [Candidatus Parcubacteria bacterium]